MTNWNFADIYEAVAGQGARPPVPDPGRPASSPGGDFDRRANALAADLLGRRAAATRARWRPTSTTAPSTSRRYVAAFKGGFAPVNTNYRYGPEEIVYLFDNADAEAVVFHATFADAARAASATACRRCGAGTAWPTARRPCPEWAVALRDGRRPPGADRCRGAVGPLAATTSCCSTPAARPACPRA